MADVNPLKLVDLGSGQGQLREMQAGDKIPGGLLPATEWSADTVSQPEAEAGASTTRRAWTSERVRQAIVGWWNGATSAFGRGLVAAADAAAGRSALGLGTAAVANLTTSVTDTTAGRVLRVGDGGWLGASDNDAYGPGYPATLVENVSQIYRRSSTDTGGVEAYSASIHFAAVDTWGRLRVAYYAPRAWVQGGLAGPTGWSAELYHTGNLTPNVLATYTLATLPSAAANPRLQVYCSNLTGQPAPVYSDGTNWRRVSDNTIAN